MQDSLIARPVHPLVRFRPPLLYHSLMALDPRVQTSSALPPILLAQLVGQLPIYLVPFLRERLVPHGRSVEES